MCDGTDYICYFLIITTSTLEIQGQAKDNSEECQEVRLVKKLKNHMMSLD